MKNKTIIHEFDPCIYPRLLWVVKGGSLEDINDMFENELADNRLGYCVWFPKAGDIRNLDWIAHESSHVALCIFNDVGAVITFEGQEPFAYLVGWVFKCVDEVRKWKEVVDNGRIESEQAGAQEVSVEEACEEEKENRNG